jgi:hypothetical protein
MATMTEIMARETQDEVEGPAEFFTGRVSIRGQFGRRRPRRPRQQVNQAQSMAAAASAG